MFCDAQTPPADSDDAPTVDVALCAPGSHLYAGGHGKSVFEKALASLRFHMPEYGKVGNSWLPITFKALQGFQLQCPGRSRKPHPLSRWLVFAMDLAGKDHPVMAVWVLLAVHGYFCRSGPLSPRRCRCMVIGPCWSSPASAPSAARSVRPTTASFSMRAGRSG